MTRGTKRFLSVFISNNYFLPFFNRWILIMTGGFQTTSFVCIVTGTRGSKMEKVLNNNRAMIPLHVVFFFSDEFWRRGRLPWYGKFWRGG